VNSALFTALFTGTYGAYGGLESGWKQGYTPGEFIALQLTIAIASCDDGSVICCLMISTNVFVY